MGLLDDDNKNYMHKKSKKMSKFFIRYGSEKPTL